MNTFAHNAGVGKADRSSTAGQTIGGCLPYNRQEMVTDQSLLANHPAIHCWGIRFSPPLLTRLNMPKPNATIRSHLQDAYIRVRARHMCLYHVDDTDAIFFGNQLALGTVKRFLRKALNRDSGPSSILTDGRPVGKEFRHVPPEDWLSNRAPLPRQAVCSNQGEYLSNRIERDRRPKKHRAPHNLSTAE